MSLVGSLEDLGLGDILQIISLSRKSGVLLLRSEHGEGQILFRDGRVTGATCKGGPTDLRSLLVGDEVVSEEVFAGAVRTARAGDTDLEAALCALPDVGRERLDELRRIQVERAAFTMFAWPTGEFSFEVREEFESVDPALCIEPGIDAQFLAMEGARLGDESDRDQAEKAEAGSDPFGFAELGAELRGETVGTPLAGEEIVELEALAEPLDDADVLEAVAEPLPPPSVRAALEPALEAVTELEEPALPEGAADAIAMATLERVDSGPAEEAVPAEIVELEAVVEPTSPPSPQAEELFAVAEEPVVDAPLVKEPAGDSDAPRSGVPVVVLDPNLNVLEWAKRALSEDHERVHIFQKTELAIARIRQYLIRHETPLVLVSQDAPPDPNSGARSPGEIVARLKAQAGRLTTLLLADAGSEVEPQGADAVLQRPTPTDLYNPRRVAVLTELAEGLRRDVAAQRSGSAPSAATASGDARLRRLREVSAELRAAAPRGEIIPVVMRFASELFGRVAMFLVRDQLALGMAGHGLERAGGPDDAGLREVALQADGPSWFRRVLAGAGAVRGAPEDDGDRELCRLLGNAEPGEAYVAPLESGDRIVALLYADNLPEGGSLGETQALEVVLHEAGMALDRAALERQLAEAESGA
jgi:hypothetical protein